MAHLYAPRPPFAKRFFTPSPAGGCPLCIPIGWENPLLSSGSWATCTRTQCCNWSAEPYTVAFYMRSADGPWGRCYFDHQANRWRNVAMTYDPASDTVTVTERGTWQAALDRKRSVFAIGDGKPKGEVDAPQRTPRSRVLRSDKSA